MILACPDVVWRRHPVYENYEVSSDGRVRVDGRWIERRGSGRRWHPPAELTQHITNGGYPAVRIRKAKNKAASIRVHVLVCETFHGLKPAPGMEVRHLNGIPDDNRPDNLAWGTRSENSQDTVRHGRNKSLQKTHCPHGHEYTPENTGRGGHNERICRTCVLARQRRRALKQRLRGEAPPHLHGTPNAYSNYGCRCDRCKQAWSTRLKARRGRGISS